jgi:integrase
VQLITQLKAGLGFKRITARGEDRLPGDLSVDDIENFLVKRQAEVIENKGNCTASYLDIYITTIKAAFNHCRVRCDAVMEIKHRQVQKPKKVSIPEEALVKIRKTLPRSVQAVMLFKECVPCRCWELYDLTVDQVDLVARKIRLRADQTKNAEARELPIPEILLPYFNWIVGSGSKWTFPRIEIEAKTGQLLFRKMLSNYVSSQWRKVRRAKGLPEEIKFRLLRHNAVSKYLHNGVSGGVVADIMGASEETMRTFYEVVPIELKNREADRIAGIKHGVLTESLNNILPFKTKTASASA